MIKRVLCALLEHARLFAIGNVVLVLAETRQYRVRQNIFTRLCEGGWIERGQQTGDLCEYSLTETGKQLANKLKAHEGQFEQLVLFELEEATRTTKQTQETQMSLF